MTRTGLALLLQLRGLVIAGTQRRRKLVGAQAVHTTDAKLHFKALAAAGIEKAIPARPFLLDRARIIEDLHADPLHEFCGDSLGQSIGIERHMRVERERRDE